jgi:hypothetical protein
MEPYDNMAHSLMMALSHVVVRSKFMVFVSPSVSLS